ncbi:MAG: type II secretion system F family protein [Solobacterium sp.]|nr:type II secretion system F family protein [Solobacterium sp.]
MKPAAVAFFPKRRSKKKLSKETMQGIASLMNSGFSLQQTLTILDDPASKLVFDEIRARLESGEAISDFLCEYTPAAYARYLSGFLMYMPFHNALALSLSIVDTDDRNQNELLKGLLYPVLMMVGMLGASALFSLTILPAMISLLEGFQLEDPSYGILKTAIPAAALTILILLAAAAVIFMISIRQKNIVSSYCFLLRFLKDSLPVQIASRNFTRFFLECVRQKLSTIQCMDILMHLPGRPVVSYIARMLDQEMRKGSSLEDAVHTNLLESSLSRFMKTAIYSSDCEKMLEGYLEMTKARTETQIRRFSRTVQFVSYLLIGVMIVLMYRLLLMPMNMMQRI